MAVHTLKFVRYINKIEDKVLSRGILNWFNRNLSKQSVEKYERPVLSFLRFSEGKLKRHVQRRDINLKLINAWLQWRDDQISRRTLAADFATLKHLFKYLSEGPEKIFQENPLTGASVNKRRYPPRPTPVLSDKQIHQLMKYLEAEKYKWLERKKWVSYRKARNNEILTTIFLSTGMAVSSLILLKISDFNNEPGNYFLKEFRGKNQTSLEKTLSGRVGKLLSDFLSDYRKNAGPDEYLFPGTDGVSKKRGQTVSNQIGTIVKRSGVTPHRIRTHALRATYAVQLFFKGLPLVSVKQKMGHSDIATTMIYLQLATATGIDATLDPMNPETPENFRKAILGHPV